MIVPVASFTLALSYVTPHAAKQQPRVTERFECVKLDVQPGLLTFTCTDRFSIGKTTVRLPDDPEPQTEQWTAYLPAAAWKDWLKKHSPASVVKDRRRPMMSVTVVDTRILFETPTESVDYDLFTGARWPEVDGFLERARGREPAVEVLLGQHHLNKFPMIKGAATKWSFHKPSESESAIHLCEISNEQFEIVFEGLVMGGYPPS